MTVGQIKQRAITCRQGRIKDDPNVHHDVDEIGIRTMKRTQTARLLIEAQRKRAARMDHDVFQ